MKNAAKAKDYTDLDRKNDFHYFADHYKELFGKYGKGFVAIRNKEVLGASKAIEELLERLRPEYEPGSYSLQECDDSEAVSLVRIQRLSIGG